MNNQLSFKELKDRVSIMQVAMDLGYVLDKSKGNSQPSFVLMSGGKEETDRIYIKNPNNPSIQGYWRRGSYSKGDVISFVKENLSSFPESRTARNEIDAINAVLNRYAGQPFSIDRLMASSSYFSKIINPKKFDINRYDRGKNNIGYMMCFFKKRGIDAETVKRFSNFLELVVDRDSKNKYRNLAFPYCDSSGNVVGFELRGFSGYRGKAEGTNSTSAFWCADFSEVRQPKYVFIFEGAYDAMAFQQIHNVKVRLEDCAFVSVGGSFSDEQFKQVINQYPNAKKVLCFDNDLNGRMYDIRAYGIINNLDMKTSINRENGDIKIDVGNKGIFELPEDKVSLNEFFKLSGYRQHPDLTIRKAPNGLKDWNEVLTRNLPIEDLHSAYEKKNNLSR